MWGGNAIVLSQERGGWLWVFRDGGAGVVIFCLWSLSMRPSSFALFAADSTGNNSCRRGLRRREFCKKRSWGWRDCQLQSTRCVPCAQETQRFSRRGERGQRLSGGKDNGDLVKANGYFDPGRRCAASVVHVDGYGHIAEGK